MLSAWKAALKKPGMALVCLLSIALGFSVAANFYHYQTTPVIAAPAKDFPSANWRTAFSDVADKLAPSVVFITSEKTIEVTNPFGGFDDFFNFGPFRNTPKTQKRVQKATGSGVIVRSDGYILTNNHVVAGADRVTVKLADGREFKGKVLVDPRTDLALVKIDANNLPAASLGDSDKVKVGQWAIALGNPFGLRNTLTVGVVSAIRKETDPDPDGGESGAYVAAPGAIQTDAAINPGNSGGPLVDLDGQIIGINFMIYTQSGGNVGVGFAIPSNTAKFVMNQLISKGKVVRGYLGLVPEDLTPAKAKVYGVKKGALISSLDNDKDAPAKKAGLKVADVITKINDREINNALDLRNTIQAMTPDTTVKLTVIRGKQEKIISVKLGEMPNDEGTSNQDTSDKIGLSVQPLTSELAKSLGIDSDIQGVVVRSVDSGSSAERAGIEPKDVIMEINNIPITSVASFSKVTKDLKSGDTAVVVVQRGERSAILEMTID